jgi:hypothetical protein
MLAKFENDILTNMAILISNMGFQSGTIDLHPCSLIDALLARG